MPVAMQFEMDRAVNGIFASVELDYTLTSFAGVFVDYLEPQVSVETVSWRATSARVQQIIGAGTWTSTCRPSYSSGYLLYDWPITLSAISSAYGHWAALLREFPELSASEFHLPAHWQSPSDLCTCRMNLTENWLHRADKTLKRFVLLVSSRLSSLFYQLLSVTASFATFYHLNIIMPSMKFF